MRFGAKKKDYWDHPIASLKILRRHPDGAYRAFEFTVEDVPAIRESSSKGIEAFGYFHRFRFALPRAYPHDLGIPIFCQDPIEHPRFGGRRGRICYQVNGELDRLLVDLVANLLMRPDVVRPPSLYPEEDHGLSRERMEWYMERGPHEIHARLLDAWRCRVRGESPPAGDLPIRGSGRTPARVEFLGDS
ncbi:MAG: hypothetical protein QF752_03235 [Planctomycetota bacterium]|jgi:hypothetical protein|nr:hypothetical protein [Planctomycetota bacterium]